MTTDLDRRLMQAGETWQRSLPDLPDLTLHLDQGTAAARRPRRVVAMVVAAGVVLLLGGGVLALRSHSRNPSATNSGSPSTGNRPQPVYVGPVTSTTTYFDTQITVRPPGSGDVPKVSWQQAYRASCASGCSYPTGARISLALVTIPDAGTRQRDGSFKPFMNRTLGYVITWLNVPCVEVGAPAPGRPSPAPPETSSCGVIHFVDAQTSKDVYAIQSTAFR